MFSEVSRQRTKTEVAHAYMNRTGTEDNCKEQPQPTMEPAASLYTMSPSHTMPLPVMPRGHQRIGQCRNSASEASISRLRQAVLLAELAMEAVHVSEEDSTPEWYYTRMRHERAILQTQQQKCMADSLRYTKYHSITHQKLDSIMVMRFDTYLYHARR